MEGGETVLRERMIPCNSREAIITVKSYKDGIMEGILQHPRLAKGETLTSLSQMMLSLNALLDLEGCPERPLPLVRSEIDAEKDYAVFRIQVLFREHYTWQGKLIWQNEGREMIFHSAIELMQLLDEILAD